MPPSPKELLEQGLLAHRSGNLSLAAEAYERILTLKPDDPEALHLLGGIALAQGDSETAIARIGAAIQAAPRIALYHANLAAAYLSRDKPSAAQTACEQALAIDQNLPEAHNHLANALLRQGKTDRALAHARRAVALQPTYAEAWLNLGNLLNMLDQAEQALSALTRAFQLNPRNPAPLISLGALLLKQGEPERAVPLFQQALSLDSSSTIAHNNLGLALQWQGQTREARLHFNSALRTTQNPLWAFRRAAACPIIPKSGAEIARWRTTFRQEMELLPTLDLSAHLDELAQSHAEPPYHLAYQGELNLELKQRYAAHFSCSKPLSLSSPKPGAKPRVAFLTTPGHEGIFLRCNAGLIAHWDTSLAELEVLAPQAVIAALSARALPRGVQLTPIDLSFRALLERLALKAFDLLYLWEVGSDSSNYFLPFFKPAHLVGTGWGTSESSGHPGLDFYLSTRAWEEPDPESVHSEPLLYMERMPICYEPTPTPKEHKPLSDFGLPVTAPVFICVQNLFKLHPDFDLLLDRLLKAEPKALAVLVSGKRPGWTAILRKRLNETLDARAERVHFLPRLSYERYQQLLEAAPFLLDSLYFSGGNTSFEALSVGTPILTLPGRLAHGRFTLGCYRQMGIADFIAKDLDDYQAKALALATEPSLALQARQRLLEAAAALRNDKEAARQFQETLLRRIEAQRNPS